MEFIKWAQFKNVIGLTTTRNNGYSAFPYNSLNLALQVGDDFSTVIKNRHLLYQNLGIVETKVIFMHQTHSTNIKKVTRNDGGKGKLDFKDGIYDCDGLYTYDSNLYLCTLHADCVPILFYASDKKIVGVIHAGWGGTIKEATYKMLKIVIENESIDVNQLYTFIGPNIQGELEIDEEISKEIINNQQANKFITINGEKSYLNIEKMNIEQLQQLGVKNIEIANHNTCLEPDTFFSYLRDNKVCGRHITLIGRNND